MKLCIANLTPETTGADLTDLFAPFGPVASADVWVMEGAGVEEWVRNFTRGSGAAGWEGHFEAGGASVALGEYEFSTTDGRTGRTRGTHIGMSSRHPTHAEFTGSRPFSLGSL